MLAEGSAYYELPDGAAELAEAVERMTGRAD
jgi:hypothetical protein